MENHFVEKRVYYVLGLGKQNSAGMKQLNFFCRINGHE
jgi:hypothetical protein